MEKIVKLILLRHFIDLEEVVFEGKIFCFSNDKYQINFKIENKILFGKIICEKENDTYLYKYENNLLKTKHIFYLDDKKKEEFIAEKLLLFSINKLNLNIDINKFIEKQYIKDALFEFIDNKLYLYLDGHTKYKTMKNSRDVIEKKYFAISLDSLQKVKGLNVIIKRFFANDKCIFARLDYPEPMVVNQIGGKEIKYDYRN